jgi:hypothetical protein
MPTGPGVIDEEMEEPEELQEQNTWDDLGTNVAALDPNDVSATTKLIHLHLISCMPITHSLAAPPRACAKSDLQSA